MNETANRPIETERKIRTFTILFIAFLAVASAVLIAGSLSDRQNLPLEDWDIRPVTSVHYKTSGGEEGELALPASLQGLAPRTKVVLWTEIEALPGESLYIKSVFAPLRVYVNDELFYEYGQAGSYPGFLNDPPTGLAILKLPAEGGTMSLRAEYQSLTQRSALSIPQWIIGDHAALLNRLLKADGFSFLFSLMLVFLGAVMTLIALTFVRKIPSGNSFLWLGLFSLAAGIWVFGECDFASRLLPYPSLLYVLDYTGLFLVAIPFLQFGLVMLKPKDERPVRLMLYVHYASVAAALALQLTGRMDFIRTLYWFHIITPLAFVVFAACLVLEGLRYKNPAARRFAPAVLLLALSTVLELANYWLGITGALTVFFQLGVLFFILSLGVVSGYYVRESLHTAAEKHRLEYEMAGVEKQLALQRLQYQKIADDEERIKKERHDFRHHLAVLRSLAGDEQKLSEYMDGLTASIPVPSDVRLCENYALNAVAAYYYTLAKQAGIEISVRLAIPRDLAFGVESDLCVVVGNLMENAVEACLRMTDGKRFIRIDSSMQGDILTIVADNSFAGTIARRDGAYLSSKREGEGIGISSVAAAAVKHGGGSRFEEDDGVFRASVYMRIDGER